MIMEKIKKAYHKEGAVTSFPFRSSDLWLDIPWRKCVMRKKRKRCYLPF